MMFGSKRNTPPKVRNPKSDSEQLSFRRSRTLTGSASSQVTAANDARAQLKSPRRKEHELRRHRKLLSTGLVVTLALLGGGIWLLDQYIVEVAVATNASRNIDTATYNKTIVEYFNTRPLERFRFATKLPMLAKYLQTEHSEVAGITLTGEPGLGATSGVVTLRKPVAAWQVASQKYYVDTDGDTFLVNAFSEPGVAVKDESGISVSTSQSVASARLLRFIGQIVGGINATEVGQVTRVTIPVGTLRQLNVTIAGHDYPIKTHMDRATVGQVADVVAAVKFLDGKSIKPEYIDARVSGKAYYR